MTLALLPGPRADWFTDAARVALFESRWRLSEQADRVGARLEGPALERRVARASSRARRPCPDRSRSRATDRPTILLADRPVTGGYPVIAIVAPASLDAVAQLRPGQEVRFRHA